jgi:hypothetical protein
MKISIAVLFAILTASLAQAQSLEGTNAWLKNHIEGSGYSHWSKGEGWSSSERETTTSFDVSGCSVTVVTKSSFSTTWAANVPNKSVAGKTVSTESVSTVTFNWSDLDPTDVRIYIDGDGDKEYHGGHNSVMINSINAEKKIKYAMKFGDGKTDGGMEAFNYFYILSPEDVRVANAVRHAITTCGGKASAF